MNEKTEEAIADYLKKNFIESGVGVTRTILKEAAISAYSSSEEHKVERFCASNKWTQRFMSTHNLSLRIPHLERRTSVDPSYREYFLNRLNTLKEDYPPSRIINCDETCWRIFQNPRLIVAEKGTEAAKILKDHNEKLSVTALGTITADGNKGPLWIITKGKTDRSLKKLGNDPSLIYRCTESGWMTSKVFLEYLEWLHNEFQGEPIALILDVYPSHKSDEVKQKAKELNIELLYVPAGGTAMYQPLDRRIFGELKSRARFEMLKLQRLQGPTDTPYKHALEVLLKCWNEISSENIIKSWNIEAN